MSKGKCRSCKHDISDDQGISRTSACPDYLDGKITDGCESYEPDEDMMLSLKDEEAKQKKEAKEKAKYEHLQYKKRVKARRKRSGDRRPLMVVATILIVGILILATLYILTDEKETTAPEVDDKPSRATENITEMIEDLVPSFVLLVFVLVFLTMLLTIVDRVGRW